jgi:hypothetical protein
MTADTSNPPSSRNGNVIKVTRAQVMAARELLDIARERGNPPDPAVAAIAGVSLDGLSPTPVPHHPSAAPATSPHPSTG